MVFINIKYKELWSIIICYKKQKCIFVKKT
jgi:hypothetical protein